MVKKLGGKPCLPCPLPLAPTALKTLGTSEAKSEIPSFTKAQDQLRAEDVEDTRVIANVRIHVKRVIGNLRKKYAILNGTLPIDYSLSKGDSNEKLTTKEDDS